MPTAPMTDERLAELRTAAREGHGFTLEECDEVLDELDRLRGITQPQTTGQLQQAMAARGEPVAWVAMDGCKEWMGGTYIFEKPPSWIAVEKAWSDDGAFIEVDTTTFPTLKAGECRPIFLGEPIAKPDPPARPLPEPVYRDDVLTVFSANGRTATVKEQNDHGMWGFDTVPINFRIGEAFDDRADAERAAAVWCMGGE